ncbi:MAG TPA: FMN-dependent NADH-azoreductase [Acetobacteraceae bacterium]|nr:FMN-dependent NADH-azoreductase [Acetobacteraceae bacterium]
MSNILLVTSSLFGDNSKSNQIAREFVDIWQATHPGTTVTERALMPDAIPHLSLDVLGAAMTPADKRSAEQAAAAQSADQLIEELEAADAIVLAAPMYNFTIPSTLKAWIDHVARAGRTFRYTANGPEGLLKGKQVFVVTGRGGIYSGDAPAKVFDFQEPYLRAILGFLGLNDVTFIHVEGLKISPEAAERGVAQAREAINAILGTRQVQAA